jgi:acetylornithine deacetylase/succinyl-diaminopimelate desuccinylase-like protein
MPTPAEFVEAQRARFEDELSDLLRIPSISTLPAHREDMQRAARWVADRLRTTGLDAEVVPTQRHPLVYAEWLGAPGRPTILCYGHYDVQPVDPLELWTAPPFEPTVRGTSLYARGAADDKGQVFTIIAAIHAYTKTKTPLPVDLKLLIEGEEESGGESIEEYVHTHADRLRADAALVLDGGMFAPSIPAITLGLRGIVGAEIEVAGASRDLHSGVYGGVAPNPFVALAEIITGLKDPQGRILIPHFYDRVEPPHPDEKTGWGRLPFDEEAFLRDEVGATALTGEPGFSVFERTWARPTLEVHGMPGGFIGEGTKTVIPARASAKISMRLVPRQDPEEISRHFESYVRHLQPRGTRVTVRMHHDATTGKTRHGAAPVLMSAEGPAIAAARRAFAEVFGHETVLIRSGGSIPIVADFISRLGLPTVISGWALPDCNVHSPNEKLDLVHFHKGIHAVMRFWEHMAATGVTHKPARPHTG